MAEIDVALNVETRKALKAVDGMKTAFKALGAVAAAAAGAFTVKKVVDAAAQQETAIRSLNTALALTGDFTEETSQSFQDFASELQKNSTIGDEVSLSMVGLAKSMGATNEQTEQIIQAAADLSAVTGQTLETSVRNLSKTLGGLKGELGETQPELAGLTAEQLKAGDAIEIMAQKYRGAAEELTKTFSGAVTQTENSFGDLLEEIGFLITQNPVVIKAVKLASEAFISLGKTLKDNRQAIIDFTIDGLAATVDAFGELLNLLSPTIAGLKAIGDIVTGSLIAGFGVLAEVSVKAADSIIKGLKSAINFGFKPLNAALDGVAQGLRVLGVISDKELADFQQTLKDLNADSSTSGLEAMTRDIENFNAAAQEGLRETLEFDNLADDIRNTEDVIGDAADSTYGFADSLRELKKVGDDANQSLKNLSDTNAALGKAPKPFAEREFLGGAITGSDITAAGSAIAQSLVKGAAGVTDLFVGGAGAAAEAFAPGTGPAAQAIAQLLAAGPDVAKAQIEAWIDELPRLLERVSEAIPVVIETLAENSDRIVLALAEGMPKVATALAFEAPKALLQVLPGALDRMLIDFREGAQFEFDKLFGDLNISAANFNKGLADGLRKAVNELGNAPEALKSAVFAGTEALKTGLANTANAFLNALFVKLPELAGVLVEQLGTFFNALGGQLGQGLYDSLASLFDALFEKLSELFARIDPTSGGGIGIGGEQFNTRRILQAVTTGGLSELDRATGGNISEGLGAAAGTGVGFGLTGDTGGAPVQVVLKIGEKQLADVLLNLNRQGYRTA